MQTIPSLLGQYSGSLNSPPEDPGYVPITYVTKGDTLSSIAEQNKVSVGELLAWNRMGDSKLQEGQMVALGGDTISEKDQARLANAIYKQDNAIQQERQLQQWMHPIVVLDSRDPLADLSDPHDIFGRSIEPDYVTRAKAAQKANSAPSESNPNETVLQRDRRLALENDRKYKPRTTLVAEAASTDFFSTLAYQLSLPDAHNNKPTDPLYLELTRPVPDWVDNLRPVNWGQKAYKANKGKNVGWYAGGILVDENNRNAPPIERWRLGDPVTVFSFENTNIGGGNTLSGWGGAKGEAYAGGVEVLAGSGIISPASKNKWSKAMGLRTNNFAGVNSPVFALDLNLKEGISSVKLKRGRLVPYGDYVILKDWRIQFALYGPSVNLNQEHQELTSKGGNWVINPKTQKVEDKGNKQVWSNLFTAVASLFSATITVTAPKYTIPGVGSVKPDFTLDLYAFGIGVSGGVKFTTLNNGKVSMDVDKLGGVPGFGAVLRAAPKIDLTPLNSKIDSKIASEFED